MKNLKLSLRWERKVKSLFMEKFVGFERLMSFKSNEPRNRLRGTLGDGKIIMQF